MRRLCDWEGLFRIPCRSRMACTVLRNTALRWGERCPAAVSRGDRLITLARAGESDDVGFHLAAARQIGERAVRERHLRLARRPAAPDDAHGDHVPGGAVDDDLVDQAAQERLLAGCGQGGLVPRSGRRRPTSAKAAWRSGPTTNGTT